MFVIDDGESYGQGLARTFSNAAETLGIAIAGTGTWIQGLRAMPIS